MAEILLHIYDIKSSNVIANIVQLNELMCDKIGAGGIFHGAIQVYDEEWSFGFRMLGRGIVSGPPKANRMYTYRETVSLGQTALSPLDVKQILKDMRRGWQGCIIAAGCPTGFEGLEKRMAGFYKNCNQFCEEFSARLGVQKPPLSALPAGRWYPDYGLNSSGPPDSLRF